MFRVRQTWAYIAGRFLIDPIWWTFLFWLPSFFASRFQLSSQQFGPPLVAVYLIADIGSIGGGWLRRACSPAAPPPIARARPRCCAPRSARVPIALAAQAPSLWIAVGLIGLACAGHQGFSANLYALPSDLFPRWMVGSVVGIGGLAGALGGMIMANIRPESSSKPSAATSRSSSPPRSPICSPWQWSI